jgi:hypothetical protein
LAQARWIEQRKARILPTHYFHVVFTLPHQLGPLCRRNPRRMYDLLFATACRSLLAFGESRLGARLGVTAVLHTWTRDLRFHPHVHCVVTGGGLATADDRWVSARGDSSISVQALSRLYRGKFLAALADAYENGELALGGACVELRDPQAFAALKDQLYRVEWVVYAKRPFGGPEQVFRYLGRYTHRIALSNRRLLRVDDDSVYFATKNGKAVAVSPTEFIRRFLLHVLPKGYVRIRHFGLMSSSNVATKLAVARRLLAELGAPEVENDVADDHAPPGPPLSDWRAWFQELTSIDLNVCPRCGGACMQRYPLLSGSATPFTTARLDTS